MPHVKLGFKLRIPPQLFDVSNVDAEGNVYTEKNPEKLAMTKANTRF